MTLTTKQLDLRGLKCPAPIVQLSTESKQLAAGTEIEALADDPAFELDVKAWCRRTGHELLRVDQSAGLIRAFIRCVH